ncbi:hypothetical protein QFZ99_008090 [Paraburkholderia atlantica]
MDGFLLEFGISLPVGNAVVTRLPAVLAEHSLPSRLISTLERAHAHFKYLSKQIGEIDKEIAQQLANDELGQSLLTILASTRSPRANLPPRWEMGDGRWEMGDGRWEMGDGRWEMGDGRWEMGDGRWEMGDGRWEMGDGRWEMGDGRWEMASSMGAAGTSRHRSDWSRASTAQAAEPTCWESARGVTKTSGAYWFNVPGYTCRGLSGSPVDSLSGSEPYWRGDTLTS